MMDECNGRGVKFWRYCTSFASQKRVRVFLLVPPSMALVMTAKYGKISVGSKAKPVANNIMRTFLLNNEVVAATRSVAKSDGLLRTAQLSPATSE